MKRAHARIWLFVPWFALAACGSSSGPHGTGGTGGGDEGGTGGTSGSGGTSGTGGTAPAPDASTDVAGDTGGAPEPDAAADTGAPGDVIGDAESPDVPANNGKFTLTSSAFKDGDTIAAMYRCAPDADVSPPLGWANAPKGTLSFAVTLAHGTTSHWQIFDIPQDTYYLPMDVAKVQLPNEPGGAMQSQTGMSGEPPGYVGPCPTTTAVSLYTFTVYALHVRSLPGLLPDSSPKDVDAALKQYALATATLTVNAHK